MYHPQSWGKNYLKVHFYGEINPNLKIKNKDVMVRKKREGEGRGGEGGERREEREKRLADTN